ncbi:MAG: hypothetical protein KatS3mg115_2123 [Candidatus Poribacteria bacterium]|nr:MAG: hypothetical protein KatS3mg115_2123 [Candidatus Poribacteria bacterium]
MSTVLLISVTLLVNVLLLGAVVAWGAWIVYRGRRQRDRTRLLKGVLIWLLLGVPLLGALWPQIAYLWTEALWFGHFVRNGAPAEYENVFWRVLGDFWKVFLAYGSLGAGFLLLNVLVASRVCPLRSEFHHWARYRTRLAHRLLALGALGIAVGLAGMLTVRWEEFALARVYRHGVGRVPAVLKLLPGQAGTFEHPFSLSGLYPKDPLREDLERLDRLIASVAEELIEPLPLIRLHQEETPGTVKPSRTPPHYTLQGYLLPVQRDPQEHSTVYRLSLVLAGPTVLEKAQPDETLPERERIRRQRTGQNYVKYLTLSTLVERESLDQAVRSMLVELTQSRYLRNGFSDPIFHRNVGYYLFEFPRDQWVSLWAKLLLWATIGLIALQYRFYYHRDSHSMLAAVRGVTVHLAVLWILLLLVGIWRSQMASLGLLYARPSPIKSGRVPFGISYVDFVQIGAFRVYMVFLLILCLILAINTIRRDRRLWVGSLIAWMGGWLLILWVYPAAVYLFKVRPNPLRAERAFLENHMAMTRHAFGLEAVEQTDAIRKLASFEDVMRHPEVLQTVQLWDRRVIWERIQQSQTIQRFYEFSPFPDVDRYWINGELRQVIIAGREVNPNRLANREWFTKRLKYTHGYGVVMAPVNEAEDPGVPIFWIRGIPMQYASIPGFNLRVRRPEIYYGELTQRILPGQH